MTNLSGTNLNNATAVGPQGEGKESTSSFPAYPAYKSSGVEWLGEVPEHWTVIALKWLSPVFRGASPRPIDDPIYFDDEGEFGWVRIADVTASPDGYLYETTQKLSALGSSLSVKLEPGELFLSIAGSVGKPCITAVKACIHDGFVYFPWLSIDQRLLYRVFESGLCFGGLGKMGTQLNLNTDTVGGIYIAVPPTAELSRALAFLDHETARIDALIEEQQRLIELLKEKRQAVISHAVTKGLDPTVPMKDSGVEWLGEVPVHWERKRLKNISPFITVGIVVNPSDYVAEEGLPFIYGGEVKEGLIEVDKARKISLKDSLRNRKTMLEAGDIVTMRVGYPGLTAVVPPECEGGNCASVMLVKRGGFDSRWLCAVMNSRLVRQQVEVVQYGAAQKQFNIADAIEFWMFKPPLNEQATIAEFVEEQSSIFDDLTAESENSMVLLQERRSALISAAVTGKIDVRGWQPPVSAPTPELLQEAV